MLENSASKPRKPLPSLSAAAPSTNFVDPAASSRSTIDVEPPNLTPANGTRKKSARAGEADASTRSAAIMTLRADGSFIETSLVQDEAGSDEQPQKDLHER